MALKLLFSQPSLQGNSSQTRLRFPCEEPRLLSPSPFSGGSKHYTASGPAKGWVSSVFEEPVLKLVWTKSVVLSEPTLFLI